MDLGSATQQESALARCSSMHDPPRRVESPPPSHCPWPVVGPQGRSCESPQAGTQVQRGQPGAE